MFFNHPVFTGKNRKVDRELKAAKMKMWYSVYLVISVSERNKFDTTLNLPPQWAPTPTSHKQSLVAAILSNVVAKYTDHKNERGKREGRCITESVRITSKWLSDNGSGTTLRLRRLLSSGLAVTSVATSQRLSLPKIRMSVSKQICNCTSHQFMDPNVNCRDICYRGTRWTAWHP
jgi:hypothetical protein